MLIFGLSAEHGPGFEWNSPGATSRTICNSSMAPWRSAHSFEMPASVQLELRSLWQAFQLWVRFHQKRFKHLAGYLINDIQLTRKPPISLDLQNELHRRRNAPHASCRSACEAAGTREEAASFPSQIASSSCPSDALAASSSHDVSYDTWYDFASQKLPSHKVVPS